MEDYGIYPAIHVKTVPVMIYRDVLHRFYSFFCLRYNAVTGASVLVHITRSTCDHRRWAAASCDMYCSCKHSPVLISLEYNEHAQCIWLPQSLQNADLKGIQLHIQAWDAPHRSCDSISDCQFFMSAHTV